MEKEKIKELDFFRAIAAVLFRRVIWMYGCKYIFYTVWILIDSENK